MAEIIGLAEARQKRGRQVDAPIILPSGLDVAAFRRAAKKAGFEVEARAGNSIRPRTPEEESAYLCRRIQQIADNLGIDVEAPFRPRAGRKR